jgi:glycosyltransferase involved in cell wall biosynthesis
MLFVYELSERTIPESDVIVATAWQTAEQVMNLSPKKGNKVYLIQSYEDWSGPRERVDATWKLPMKKVVIAQWLLDKGIELGVHSKDMFYIPNAIDMNTYRILSPIPGRKKRVAMVYSPLAVKGAADGIRAIILAKDQVPDLETTVFGTSHQPSGLPPWITYRRNPSQTEIVCNIYNWASVFVSSSLTEGWPLPGAEALACGCALASTDNKGVREYAEDDVTALLSPSGKPEELAKNILRLLMEDHVRQRIAENGHRRMRNFSWDKSVDMFCQVITQ